MLATSIMYNDEVNHHDNVLEEGETNPFVGLGMGATLPPGYTSLQSQQSNTIQLMRQPILGGEIMGSPPRWHQQIMNASTPHAGVQHFPIKMNQQMLTTSSQNMNMNQMKNNSLAYQQLQQQSYGMDLQTHLLQQRQQQLLQQQLQQESAFMPMASFYQPAQQQQTASLLLSQSTYNDGSSHLQKPMPFSASGATIASKWNPSMAMPDPHPMAPTPSFYSIHQPMQQQDTPQTQQAIALQKAALQQQMQFAYNEAQQFEQQLALRHQPTTAQPFMTQEQQWQQPQHQTVASAHLAVSAYPSLRPAVTKKHKKRKAQTFPEKFMDALMRHDANENIVAWLPDGKSFVIVDPKLFVKIVLGPVFKHTKYASFVRKLHRWGFQRMTSGSGTECFYHPLFQRNRKDLASRLTCTPRENITGKILAAKNQQRHADGRDDDLSSEGLPDFLSINPPPSLAGVDKFAKAPIMQYPNEGAISEGTSCGTSTTLTAASTVLGTGLGLENVGHSRSLVSDPITIGHFYSGRHSHGLQALSAAIQETANGQSQDDGDDAASSSTSEAGELNDPNHAAPLGPTFPLLRPIPNPADDAFASV
ncbi:hypothetical protein MPSEU_000082700 [Mayamaea pseudoterrestris]|nr:hypothetical protein MPSEU_000082700 [Mayamaea pseudoterrestris]